jgi:hypothetical protein
MRIARAAITRPTSAASEIHSDSTAGLEPQKTQTDRWFIDTVE